ncbi:MAG: hypothetical protein ACLVJO_09635 [[Clostridium] scindens]
MREVFRTLRAEFWKMKHTLLPLLHLLIPAAGAAIFLGYYRFAALSDMGQVSGYIQVWPSRCLWWQACCAPCRWN